MCSVFGVELGWPVVVGTVGALGILGFLGDITFLCFFLLLSPYADSHSGVCYRFCLTILFLLPASCSALDLSSFVGHRPSRQPLGVSRNATNTDVATLFRVKRLVS